MKYTVRFCHMKYPAKWQVGETITEGDQIGTMGNTGTKLIHLHMDMVEGYHPEVYRLKDIMNMISDLAIICGLFFLFLTAKLFKYPLFISSHFGTPDYGKYKDGKVVQWIFHPAYDVVPEDRRETEEHYRIFWPVDFQGVVISKGFDLAYGNYINILFER